MQPDQTGPPQREQTAERHEKDKGQVGNQDEVGGQTVEHFPLISFDVF